MSDCKEDWAPENGYFQTVVLKKTLESPWHCKKIQPVYPKGIHWKDWGWSWSSKPLATWCEELTHWILVLGKIEGRRRRGRQRTRWLDGNTKSMDMGLGELQEWWWTGRRDMLQSMGLWRVGHDRATKRGQRCCCEASPAGPWVLLQTQNKSR